MVYHLWSSGIPSLAQQEPQTGYMHFFVWNGEEFEEELVKRIWVCIQDPFFCYKYLPFIIVHLKKNQSPKYIL